MLSGRSSSYANPGLEALGYSVMPLRGDRPFAIRPIAVSPCRLIRRSSQIENTNPILRWVSRSS
jgi:hypothetical protein